MRVTRADQLSRAFAQAFAAHDMERLMTSYEPDVTYVLRSGQAVHGMAAVREVFQRLFSFNADFEIENKYCLVNGDVALVRAQRRLRGTSAVGEPVDVSAQSAKVLRRQADGTRRYAVDHPVGAGREP